MEALDQMAAVAVAEAVRAVIRLDEIHGTRSGRAFLAEELERLARSFRAYGADASDLYEIVIELRKGGI